MPFKIVETLEKGKRTLFYVPNDWENNNVLHWPKFKVETLMAIEDSQPDSSWSTMKCKVKRTGLESIASAEKELANMCAKSDTESEESENMKSKHIKRDNSIQNYFDEIAQTCTVDYKKKLQQSTNDTESSILFTYIPSTSQTNCSYDEKNNVNSMTNSESQHTKVNESTVYVDNTPAQLVDSTYNYAEKNDKIDNLIATCQTLSENQFTILEYVKNIENKVLQKLSHISAQIDTLATVNSRNQRSEDKVIFQIISNKEELQTFEQNLALPEFRQGIKLRLESVCGKGKGRGVNNAYTLADIMFTRQFMTQCSWAGGSKNNTNKICFKIYCKTIDLFFEVIHGSDKDFSRKECEDFFKNIMRHAVRRNKPEIKRAPACKRRRQKQNVSQSANDKESDNDDESNDNVNNQPTVRSTTNNKSSYNISVPSVTNQDVPVVNVAPVVISNMSGMGVAPIASGNVSVTSVAPVTGGNLSGACVAPINLSVVTDTFDDAYIVK